MTGRARLDDPRLVTAGAATLVSAALWLLVWSVMGRGDPGLLDICRAALGVPLPVEAERRLAELAAALAPGAWSARLVAETAAMWVLMMAAMMLPAMTSILATYADIARIELRGAALAARIAVFGAAYFALWSVFALVAAIAQLGLRASAFFSLDGATAGPLAGGALLIVAGLYQFTTVKQACLTKCRQPMTFLMAEWRPGFTGAARIGLRHGLHCLGCCVALMALMFVFGAMNVWWMAVIAIYCVAEKIAPGAERWSRYAGAAMIIGGAGMAVSQF